MRINMFLAWFPKYLEAARGMTLTQMGFFASLPLAAGVIGDLAGGWFSDEIIKKTGRIKFARKVVAVTGFFIAAVVCPLAVMEPDPYISARCSVWRSSVWNWWWAMPGRCRWMSAAISPARCPR